MRNTSDGERANQGIQRLMRGITRRVRPQIVDKTKKANQNWTAHGKTALKEWIRGVVSKDLAITSRASWINHSSKQHANFESTITVYRHNQATWQTATWMKTVGNGNIPRNRAYSCDYALGKRLFDEHRNSIQKMHEVLIFTSAKTTRARISVFSKGYICVVPNTKRQVQQRLPRCKLYWKPG